VLTRWNCRGGWLQAPRLPACRDVTEWYASVRHTTAPHIAFNKVKLFDASRRPPAMPRGSRNTPRHAFVAATGQKEALSLRT